MHYLFMLCFAWLSLAATPAVDYSGRIMIGQHRFSSETADTPHKMQRGMMFRRSMADDQAMIFIYSRPQAVTFWMKNTRIALDMLFFDASGELLEIKHNVPPCKNSVCPTYPSRQQNIQYVVELKGGISEKLGIHVGNRLRVKRL